MIMAGLAEMLGGAISMGLAALISARSQVEFYKSEVQRERDEIRLCPERERDEVRLIYRNKGFSGKRVKRGPQQSSASISTW
jgi:VIT1/CCC1 family predicted Fe2+/Mn2+ transporter